MTEHEEGTQQCLNNHTALLSEFGTDMSSPNKLNKLCRSCVRERREQQREREREGLAKENLPDCKKSEVAIERQKQKRAKEKEIEIRLATDYQRPPVIERSSESTFAGLSWHLRRAKTVNRGWFCPVGVCSK